MISAAHDPSILANRLLVAYVRCSDEKSDAERQRASIRSWADRHGLTISVWFEDIEGRNARDQAEKRLKFQAMLKLVESGKVGGVIVDSIERLGFKDSLEFGYFIHIFRQHGTYGWATVEGNLNAVDPATVFTNTAKAVASQLETSNISRRNLSKKILDAKQGLYQGGYPPHGFDVVCFDHGKEIWRVVYDGGQHRRVKVSANGTRTRYDGKGNFPSKDQGQELRIRPSIEFADRLDVVREMFRWMATENISPQQVATRLNLQGIKPQICIAWNKITVKALLKNPAYVGFPTYNKQSSSKFFEWSNGQAQPAPIEPGAMQAKTGRKQQKTNWITTEERQFPPIVKQEVFDLVQKKFEAASRRPPLRSPKSETYWLRNLLFCGRCGQPMRAWNEHKWRSYLCSTYGLYGPVNPTGCRCHRVRADLIEKIVEDYLEETGRKIAVIYAAIDLDDVSPQIWIDYVRSNEKTMAAQKRLLKMVASFLEEGEQVVELLGHRIPVLRQGDEIELPDGFSAVELFEHFTARRRAEVIEQLATKESEFDQVFRQFKNLKSKKAMDAANNDMLRIEAEIEAIKADLTPLDAQLQDSFLETMRRLDAVEACRKAMRGANYRRRAEVLKGLIERVVCHFTYTQRTAMNQPANFLDRVEIFPTVGDPWECFPNGKPPGPDY